MSTEKEWIGTAIRIYDQHATHKSPKRQVIFEKAYSELLNKCPIKKGDIILDLGCGCGEITGALSGAEVTVIGIDISKNSIRQAKLFYPQSNFLCADMNRLPFKEQCFDLITAMSSLEFCYDKAHILREVRGKLSDNGKLYIEVRNNDFIVLKLLGPFLTLFEKNFFVEEYPVKGFRDLGYNEWIKLFRNNGYVVEAIFDSLRPWNYGSPGTRFKNIIIKIIRYLYAIRCQYTVGFLMKRL